MMCLKYRINYYNYQPGTNIVNVDNYFKHITHTQRIPLSLLRKSSRSRRLWESPHIPTERYERRPCLCVFVARFDRRIFFTIRQKRIRGGGAFAQGNSEPAADGATMPLSQRHAWLGPPYTIPSVVRQHCIHTGVY